MITGVGVDIVEKERIERIFLKYGTKFVAKILSNREIKEFNKLKTQRLKIKYLSNNFAGKESVSKAMGTGFSLGLTPNLIEILRDEKGAPIVKLLGIFSKEHHSIKLSLSDLNNLSLSFAVIEN